MSTITTNLHSRIHNSLVYLMGVDIAPDSTARRQVNPIRERTFAYVIFRAALIITATMFAFAHVWSDLAHLAFHDEESSHIAITPIIFLWLTWIRRDRFRKIASEGQAAGLLFLLAAMVVHEIGIGARMIVVWHASAVIALWGGLCLSFGVRYLGLFAPAVISLVFLMPVPGLVRQEISLPLQLYSAMLTEWCLSSVGMDIVRSGCLLSVNGTHVLVAEACNGMRMLFSVMVVVYTIFFSMQTSRVRKLVLLICSPVVAMLMNTVRLISTVAIYGTASEFWAEAFHDINGWLIPMSVMLAAIWLTGKQAVKHVKGIQFFDRIPWRRKPLRNAVFALILGLVIVFSSWRPPPESRIVAHHQAVARTLERLPYCIGDWIAVDGEIHREEIALLKPIVALRRHYKHLKSDRTVTVAAFASQHARDLIGHEPGICMSGQGWTKQRQVDVEWSNLEYPVYGRDYEFEGPVHSGLKRVASVLMVPTGKSSGDPVLVADAASDFRLGPYGALLVQFSTDGTVGDEQWQKTTTPFVEAMGDTFNEYRRLEIW